ncbi:MAG: hypothetical protein KGQ66_18400 [Acidobacteriota bacterium]|nr:hypothetical protein [Acidobacteriota bacterium]
MIGAPWPGSAAEAASLTPGPQALLAVDRAFNADSFVAWARTVYERAIASWRTGDPAPLRPVMAEAVWHDYAQHLLVAQTWPLFPRLMASARATAALAGTSVSGGFQTALLDLLVTTDPAAFATAGLDDRHSEWQEQWLFQRPAGSRTHPCGAVAVCPVCGAPADPEEKGSCRYCHSDITSRTAGWLVTRTATTLRTLADIDAKLDGVRHQVSSRIDLPPAPVVAPPPQPPRATP